MERQADNCGDCSDQKEDAHLFPHLKPQVSSLKPSPITAYVAVGSNIQPERFIPQAMELLRRQVRVTATSTFFRSAAEGRPGQPAFVNGAWQIRTSLEPRPLKFEVLRRIEDQLGRRRQSPDKFADRTIDLDLVLYDERMMDEPDMVIPDPGIARPFVAVPLLELAPGLVLPDGRPLAELPGAADRKGLVPLADLTMLLRAALRQDVRTQE